MYEYGCELVRVLDGDTVERRQRTRNGNDAKPAARNSLEATPSGLLSSGELMRASRNLTPCSHVL